ncbi:hypothetical protein MYP_4153 [Sporocytophaga myxococcoides]|uniref:Uncharacterized protein n=1 Tax=Sporocytophaga myxococcoides TaxID=153721 RepID=A0A098LLB9_9BACT|nr:hypothetical protein MYP_4153 [Sporocytophaga myxococcoides]
MGYKKRLSKTTNSVYNKALISNFNLKISLDNPLVKINNLIKGHSENTLIHLELKVSPNYILHSDIHM